MPATKNLLKAESTLTDRYQTTIPEMVRKALHLGKGDKLEFFLDDSGQVQLRKHHEEEHFDPALLAFLDLLEKDILENPEKLVPLTKARLKRIAKLTEGVEVDIDEVLETYED